MSVPPEIRKPQKLPAGAPATSSGAWNQTLPAPSVSEVAGLGKPTIGNTANPLAAVLKVNVVENVSGMVTTKLLLPN